MDGGIFNTFFVWIHQSLITVPQTTYSTYALPLACHLLPVALTFMDVGIWRDHDPFFTYSFIQINTK